MNILSRMTQWVRNLFAKPQSSLSPASSVPLKKPPEQLTDGQFWAAVRDGRRDFKNVILVGVNLAQKPLQGYLFTGADFRMARPGGEGVDLTSAELSGANLQGVNLQGANLENAILQAANLRGTQLSRSNLKAANLCQAKLSQAVLVQACLDGSNLSAADLSQANLYHAYAQGVNAYGANLQGTNLSHADLSHSVLTQADLSHANLAWANLQASNLCQVQCDDINLSYCDLHDSAIRTIAHHTCGMFWAPNRLVVTPLEA
jgi:uncharacterized protein YjbI with pentapeptide repeats